MPKVDRSSVPRRVGSRYPKPFDAPCKQRSWLQLGLAGGLSQFGVNLVTVEPGAWSSQRHWHALEDEFVYVLDGEVALIEDEGEQPLGPGDCAAFPAGSRNGHHLINRGARPATILVVGSRNPDDHGEYSDIDMKFTNHPPGYRRKDGSPIVE